MLVTFQAVARLSWLLPRSRQMPTTEVSSRKKNTITCGMMKLNGDGLRRAAGDVPLLLLAGNRVDQGPHVDRERHGGQHQHLPAERAEGVEREHDLHEVEAGVEQQPGRRQLMPG